MPNLTTADSFRPWTPTIRAVGVLLVVTEVLQVGGTVLEGFVVPGSGQRGLPGDVLHRIGFAFITNITVANGLVLCVATFLLAFPGFFGAPQASAPHVRIGAYIVVVVGALVFVGTGLAVRTRLHQIALLGQPVLAYERLSLFTYLAGGAGAAAAAIVLALRLARKAPEQ